MSIQKMFRRPEKYNQSAGTNPATPAEKAAAVWDRRVGSAVTQAYNWRRATILMGIACLVLAGGLVVQSLKTQVIPYVVTVDKNTGEVEKAGAFTGADYTPGEAEKKYFITKFVLNARSVVLDPVAQTNDQREAVAYLTTNAANKYEMVKQNEKFDDKFGNCTVTPHIVSIQKVPDSETSYQVRWTEEEYGIRSGDKKTRNMSGVFSYTMLPVEGDALQVNPLGLFITGFDFSNDASQVNSGSESKKKS